MFLKPRFTKVQQGSRQNFCLVSANDTARSCTYVYNLDSLYLKQPVNSWNGYSKSIGCAVSFKEDIAKLIQRKMLNINFIDINQFKQVHRNLKQKYRVVPETRFPWRYQESIVSNSGSSSEWDRRTLLQGARDCSILFLQPVNPVKKPLLMHLSPDSTNHNLADTFNYIDRYINTVSPNQTASQLTKFEGLLLGGRLGSQWQPSNDLSNALSTFLMHQKIPFSTARLFHNTAEAKPESHLLYERVPNQPTKLWLLTESDIPQSEKFSFYKQYCKQLRIAPGHQFIFPDRTLSNTKLSTSNKS